MQMMAFTGQFLAARKFTTTTYRDQFEQPPAPPSVALQIPTVVPTVLVIGRQRKKKRQLELQLFPERGKHGHDLIQLRIEQLGEGIRVGMKGTPDLEPGFQKGNPPLQVLERSERGAEAYQGTRSRSR